MAVTTFHQTNIAQKLQSTMIISWFQFKLQAGQHAILLWPHCLVMTKAHTMCESVLGGVLSEILEQLHDRSCKHGVRVTYFSWSCVKMTASVLDPTAWTQPTVSAHSYTWPISHFFRNMTTVFLGLFYPTVVLVTMYISSVRIHKLSRAHSNCSLIMSSDLVVIGMAPVGSAYSARRFG